ncbi:unnamed protein product [Vitrella brassicaformis CCMP3155]|uniref:Uncharacterized protein n=1 Tax=Vitrella brassicaformis (strain CCMP3155) TaxID=1169540 RepID=A0A0G4H4S9_VITBC|nr:unnamed protein product [Vitrella brassicaformis CCMP3155]|eukprot:CEM38665.1 unnamed protein product [Vitrella brassicaformis CCMP3155]
MSYSQLEALIDAHTTQFTPAVLLPILQRRLSVVVAAIFGALVEVPIPQLTQGAAVTVALTRALIEQLSRRLFMLERGGDWARWKPVLEMLYLLRGKRPLVLADDNFGVFGSRAAFMSETEAVRQWKILSCGVTVGYQQRPLMDGNGILCLYPGRCLPSLLASASPLFLHAPFDPADPPTELADYTYPNYSCMVGFIVFCWLPNGHPMIRVKYCCYFRRVNYCCFFRCASAAYLRVGELLAASPTDAAQWGAEAAVFDEKRDDRWHRRLVMLGSEAMSEGHMAVIRLVRDMGRGDDRCVIVSTTESAPHNQTRTVVMEVLGDQLGGKVWRQENEGR